MPTVVPKSWLFVQTGGDKKTLLLSAWSAPFGRPRQKAVVQDGIEIRETEIYYAGNDVPTRHIFGAKYQPWELTGRFRDAESGNGYSGIQGGVGYARSKTEEVKSFVYDQQTVNISWGNILACTGFIKLFEPRREAEYEVEWRMIILVDMDTSQPAKRVIPPTRSPGNQATLVTNAMLAYVAKVQRPGLKPGLLEGLENAVASVNSAIANVTTAVNSISSFEKAISGDIKRLRAGLGQLQTAALALQGTVASAKDDAILLRRSAEFDTDWMSAKVANEVLLLRTLGLMRALDKQAEIADRGRTISSYVVLLGDTWESIATKLLGGPDKAQKLRDINAVKYGTYPVPGTSVKVAF